MTMNGTFAVLGAAYDPPAKVLGTLGEPTANLSATMKNSLYGVELLAVLDRPKPDT